MWKWVNFVLNRPVKDTVSLDPLHDLLDRKELVARYRRLRKVSIALNQRLVERFPGDVMRDGGKKLGFLQRDIFMFDSEEDSSILMDYCMYHVHRQGRNAVEQYLADFPTRDNADEAACLDAMLQAKYSAFVVQDVVRGLGTVMQDIQSKETHLVVDLLMGDGGVEVGTILATRLLPHADFWMTGGASLPVAMMTEGNEEEVTRLILPMLKRRAGEELDPAVLIRTCLKLRFESLLEYEELEEVREFLPLEVKPRFTRVRPLRNGKCPCGSGRKYKNCCADKDDEADMQ